jgi:catechol 2,3-dioxygenase-like lactoylglutathione lyase family enzyme
MTNSLVFDHAIILVHDLEKATSDYRALGFNVFFGGEHVGGKTHNALIVFQDGTYLELLAPTDPALLENIDPNDRANFLFMFARGEGFGGYAMCASDLQAEVDRMQARGLSVNLRPPNGRARPDGQQLRWRSAMFEGTMTPFFIQDDTPRNLRVTDDSAQTLQPNGVTGVAGIMVASNNLNNEIVRYSAILDAPPQQQDATTADFALGGTTITLAVPAGDESDVGDYLTQRGEVPYKLWLWTNNGDKAGALDSVSTHGAHIELMG